MHKRQTCMILSLMALLLVLWALLRFWQGNTAAGDPLTVTALSVGKADALIIRQADQVILIDAGEEEDGERVVQALLKDGVEKIDLFLVTHFDKDHVGGAARVLREMEVSCVLLPDYEGDRPEYFAFQEELKEHPDVQRVDTPLCLSLGDLQVSVYPAEDPQTIFHTEDEWDNDLSLVTSIRYGSRGFLLTGDIEEERIRQMLSSDTDWNHDWIKMPHHGRYQSTLAAFLDAVSPKAAVICCSNKKPAEEETLALLKEKGIPVWDTKDQAVVTMCDGETITVKYMEL